MSIQISLWPHPHCARYFCDMMRVRESPAGDAGMMDGVARKADFSAGEICVGACPLSRFRAFTKSICDDTPAV